MFVNVCAVAAAAAAAAAAAVEVTEFEYCDGCSAGLETRPHLIKLIAAPVVAGEIEEISLFATALTTLDFPIIVLVIIVSLSSIVKVFIQCLSHHANINTITK